jgi:hypothetical protein
MPNAVETRSEFRYRNSRRLRRKKWRGSAGRAGASGPAASRDHARKAQLLKFRRQAVRTRRTPSKVVPSSATKSARFPAHCSRIALDLQMAVALWATRGSSRCLRPGFRVFGFGRPIPSRCRTGGGSFALRASRCGHRRCCRTGPRGGGCLRQGVDGVWRMSRTSTA